MGWLPWREALDRKRRLAGLGGTQGKARSERNGQSKYEEDGVAGQERSRDMLLLLPLLRFSGWLLTSDDEPVLMAL
jgi:hypothetical protein